jgi:hypothetical protein
MSRKQQYNTIPSPDEEGGQHEGTSQRSASPLLGGSSDARSWFARTCGRVKRPVILLLGLLAIALLLTFGLTFLLPSNKHHAGWPIHPVKPGISLQAQQLGLQKCKAIKAPRVENKASTDRSNPRGQGVAPILLTNANVWDGQGNIVNNVDILLADGLVRDIGKNIKALPKDIKTIDVKGHVVSPGLVDMHS